MENETQADFDEFADNYQELLTRNVKGLSGTDCNYFCEYKIVEIASYLENSTILDFGCGCGNSAEFIIRHIGSFKYHGIDISEKSIQKASSKNIDGCDFSLYDGSHIPFPDGTFDVVFVACVFHHIDADKHMDVLREIYRVLKNKGKVIIFEHNPLNPLTVLTVRDCPFDVGVTLIRAGKMRQNLTESGFSQNSVKYTIFMPRGKLFRKMLPLERFLKWLPVGAQYYVIGEKKNAG